MLIFFCFFASALSVLHLYNEPKLLVIGNPVILEQSHAHNAPDLWDRGSLEVIIENWPIVILCGTCLPVALVVFVIHTISYICDSMSVCVFSSHSFWTPSSLDVPAGVTQDVSSTFFLRCMP